MVEGSTLWVDSLDLLAMDIRAPSPDGPVQSDHAHLRAEIGGATGKWILHR